MTTVSAILFVAMLVGVAMGGNPEKRFLIDDTYNQAKDEFNKVAPGVDFDSAVNALIPLIHSDTSVFICTGICVASAGSIFGPGGSLIANLACPPLCDATLAKLEEEAG